MLDENCKFNNKAANKNEACNIFLYDKSKN